VARDALDLLCSTLPNVAAALDLSVDTLRSWRTLRRAPSPEASRTLAAVLRRRSKALLSMAGKLERQGGADV